LLLRFQQSEHFLKVETLLQQFFAHLLIFDFLSNQVALILSLKHLIALFSNLIEVAQFPAKLICWPLSVFRFQYLLAFQSLLIEQFEGQLIFNVLYNEIPRCQNLFYFLEAELPPGQKIKFLKVVNCQLGVIFEPHLSENLLVPYVKPP